MEPRRRHVPRSGPIYNKLRDYVRKLPNHIGDLDTKTNSSQYYRGIMYHTLSSHERDWICTRTSMRHSKGDVQSFTEPVTPRKDNQEEVAFPVAPQIRPCIKLIAIKYHHFRIFVANVDVEIKYVDTKEQIADILIKPLDPELFGNLLYNINGW